jgi:large subunit ribosomal protein L21
MYAIIRTGGKQYRVQAGETLHVEKLEKDLGSKFIIDDILIVGGKSTHVGTPTVKNAKVSVVVTEHNKDKKILVFKKKRRQGYRRTQGHRQPYTALFIESIVSPDGETVKAQTEPQVIDPAKKEARLKAEAEKKIQMKKEGKKPETKAKKQAAPKRVKKVAKKSAGKKKPAKKKASKKTKKSSK